VTASGDPVVMGNHDPYSDVRQQHGVAVLARPMHMPPPVLRIFPDATALPLSLGTLAGACGGVFRLLGTFIILLSYRGVEQLGNPYKTRGQSV